MLINKFIKSIQPKVPDHWPVELKNKLNSLIDSLLVLGTEVKTIDLSSTLKFNGKVVTIKQLFDHFAETSQVEFYDSDIKEFIARIDIFNGYIYYKVLLNNSYEGVFNATVNGLYAGGASMDVEDIIEQAHKTATIAILSTA